MNIDVIRRQGIYFNYKEKRHIVSQYSKPRESRKYFRRKLKIEKSVNKMIERELRNFIKR